MNNNSSRYYSEGQDIHYKPISAEEERELFVKARAGDEAAREFLIKNHLLLATILARKYSAGRIDEKDAISAANLGLIKAVDKFDPTRNNRFCTYLRKYVYGEIMGELKDCAEFSQLSSGVSGYRPEESEAHPVEEENHKSAVLQALRECMDELPQAEREILGLYFLQELILDEIAAIKGLTKQRIAQLKDSGVRRLRVLMTRRLATKGIEV